MINKVMLIGNVGQDPEIRSLPSGGRVSNFSLATTEYWKDKSGARQSKTEWHRIVVYNENMIKLIEKAVKKGSKLFLEGSISTRKYNDQNGNEKMVFEIIVNDSIKLLDSKASEGGYDSGSHGEKSYNSKSNTSSHNEDNVHDDDIVDDDEIPF